MAQLINDDVDVCLDCYENHHDGAAMADDSVSWTDNTSPNEEGDEDGITDFSSSPCGCCGTTLAGQRFRMAIWEL